jgi:hypothetical protein
VLEHAIWLDFVKRRLEQAFFLQLIVVVIVECAELLSLFVQELEVSSALILDILGLVCLVVPVGFLLPFFIFLLFEVSRVVEVILLLGFFPVYRVVSRVR